MKHAELSPGRLMAPELKFEGKTVSVSSLDKVMFPQTGFTKAESIDYYIRVSPVLLPHLKNRPVTLKRYPEGIHHPHFYEKNAPRHTPSWVKRFPVPRKDGSSEICFVLINDLRSLIWCVNLANLEMHTFLARAPRIDRPTSVVFDLDPGEGADVLLCAEVALRIRRALGDLRLDCLIKSSGSKGLQLYVPLNTPVSYDQTQAFARSLADHLATQDPARITARMAKAQRKGKVYIDWAQNEEHKTTVTVYSLRAKREQPYISAPLQWKEVERAHAKKKADQLFFDPEEALRRIEQLGDLFEPLLKQRQRLPRQGSAPPAAARAAAAPKRSSREPSAKLQAYASKRNFSATPEPAGKPRGRAGGNGGGVFVVQKHAARRLHYDFRLEAGGVLKSWAVPKGIPTEAGDKRLAVHVEDHPMEYADFEGTIPEGNYGAGTVMVWDTGTYTSGEPDAVKAIEKGKIHLNLRGSKLKGEWILFRFKSEEKGDTWFIMKKGASSKAISAKKDDQSAATGRSMREIAEAQDRVWRSNRLSG